MLFVSRLQFELRIKRGHIRQLVLIRGVTLAPEVRDSSAAGEKPPGFFHQWLGSQHGGYMDTLQFMTA